MSEGFKEEESVEIDEEEGEEARGEAVWEEDEVKEVDDEGC